ncbi:MAG: hypothetical protein IJW15_00950 [Clostridia bacterium]|nr:hypothetical protein [Clostridia bacterium]
MQRIGIVDLRQKKCRMRIFRRYQKEMVNAPQNPFEIVAIRLPYDKTQFDRLKQKKKQKVFEKAKKKLAAEEIYEIIFSKGLKEHCDEKSLNLARRKQIFLNMVPGCIKWISRKYGIKLPVDEICIKNTQMDRINGYFLNEICYDAVKIRLCTEDIENAKDVCERFYDETGLFVKVAKSPEPGDADILIDADGPFVKIGTDLMIDGVELDISLGGYDVDCLDIAACVKNVDFRKRILSYFSGKKKLTLNQG